MGNGVRPEFQREFQHASSGFRVYSGFRRFRYLAGPTEKGAL